MDLNEGQKAAVEYGIGVGRPSAPLLIIAGAGTGKTKTLAHRVARLVLNGTDPQRILLLTFTRRAAAEMTRRTARILGEARRASHAIGGLAYRHPRRCEGTRTLSERRYCRADA